MEISFMKKHISFILVIILFSQIGCNRPSSGTAEKKIILVSILPQKTFVEKIAGDDFQIEVLIPHGANPTTYSLLPAQMASVEKAILWFRMGYVGFELSWADKIIESARDLKVSDLSVNVDLIVTNVDNELRQGVDPHFWLSPKEVRKMAVTIRDELVTINPEMTDQYNLGLQKLLKEIDETELQVRQLLDEFQGRTFISFHPSLSYFARDFGLQQLSIEQGGKEPTSSHIARLTDIARTENIRVIYIQSDFDRENARMFAQEIKGEAIQVWPLNPEWSENMILMARLLRDHF
jgi:zinc transport system substrate-binding protein